MTPQISEIDRYRLAAVVYRPDDDVDSPLAEFAGDLQRSGARIGGIVLRNLKDEDCRPLHRWPRQRACYARVPPPMMVAGSRVAHGGPG